MIDFRLSVTCNHIHLSGPGWSWKGGEQVGERIAQNDTLPVIFDPDTLWDMIL